MSDEDYVVDIDGLGGRASPDPPTPARPAQGKSDDRPFLSIHFTCCNVYQRVYRSAEGSAYVGWCPKCARKVEAKIGPDGVRTRFFQAG